MDPKYTLFVLCIFITFSVSFSHNETTAVPLILGGNKTAQDMRDWIRQAVLRDGTRENQRRLGAFTNEDVWSGAQQGVGHFLVEISLGSTRENAVMAIDTANSLSWMNCRHLSRSTTIHTVKCSDPMCHRVSPGNCKGRKKPGARCFYDAKYSDGSYTTGQIVKDDILIGRDFVSQLYMGCAQSSSFFGDFSGMLGLGRGASNVAMKLGGTFTYRLPEYTLKGAKGNLCVGRRCPVPADSVITKILPTPFPSSMYAVGLSSISIAGKPVSLVGSDTILSAGTFISRLVLPVYNALKESFLNNVGDSVKIVPGGGMLDTCFGVDFGKIEDGMFPSVALQFGSDGEIVLPPHAVLAAMGPALTCLAFAPSGDINILGSFQQQGLLVGFNLRSLSIALSSSS